MNIYLKFLLLFILFIIIYWLYKRYKSNTERKQLNILIESIKNHITITLFNMNKFTNLPLNMKQVLIKIAQQYKHEDIIKLLS